VRSVCNAKLSRNFCAISILLSLSTFLSLSLRVCELYYFVLLLLLLLYFGVCFACCKSQ